jgi:hypothetical protein
MTTPASYETFNALKVAIEALRLIGMEKHEDENHEQYRQELKTILQSLKTHSMLLIASGTTMGLKSIGEIGDLIRVICEQNRPAGINEVFWDELSDHYQPSAISLWAEQGLSPDLNLKLSLQAIEQRENFGRNTISDLLEALPDTHFMDGVMGFLKRVSLPYRKFDPSAVRMTLDELKFRINDRVGSPFQAMVSDHILSHQEIYRPLVQKVMAIYAVQGDWEKFTDDPEGGPATVLLKLLDYSDEEIRELRGSGSLNLDKRIADLKRSMSLPAELLANLYEANPGDWIKQWAEFVFNTVEGSLPYKHFERMGIVKSPEWHMSMQLSQPISWGMIHYEHAIHTPGIDISTTNLTNFEEIVPQKVFDAGVRIIENVDLHIAESRQKAQLLFDGLALLAEAENAPPAFKESLKSSHIDPRFFNKHPKLRGGLLENRLGL